MIQRRKLNAWQILGIVLILVSAGYLAQRKTGIRPGDPVEPAMSTQPALLPKATTAAS